MTSTHPTRDAGTGEEPSTARKPHRLQQLDVATKVVGALGAILIPIVLFVLGTQHAKKLSTSEEEQRIRQEAALEVRHNLDRAAIILRHLGSESVRERRIAMHFVEYLHENNQFPVELYPVLVAAFADRDSIVRESARDILATLATRSPIIGADQRFIIAPSSDTGGLATFRLRENTQARYNRGLAER